MDSQISFVVFLGTSGMSMVRVQAREAGVNEKMKPFFFLIFCFTDLTLGSIIFQKLTRRTVALDMIQDRKSVV